MSHYKYLNIDNMKDTVISGVINFVVFYISLSTYNVYVHNESIFSLSRMLLSVFAILCGYFIGNNHNSILYKIRKLKNERVTK